MIIRDYYKQLYTHQLDSLKEMDKFLERFNLLKLNLGEIDYMDGLLTCTEVETVSKNLPTKKSPGQDDFTG